MRHYTKIGSAIVLCMSLVALPSPGQAWDGPPGFKVLCLTNPSECKGGGSNAVQANDDLKATLQKVNVSVNRAIRPKMDGRVDIWSVNASSGDCEEYVLAKRRQLIRAGLSPSALRIAYVKTRKGVDHAILVVNTDRGKLVLDNLTNTVRPLSQTSYRIVSMQTANPKHWT